MLLNGATGRRRARAEPRTPGRFRSWRRQRPFVGGLLVALGGVELFFSGQLDIGHLHVQMGIEGLQATIIPVVLVLLGVLATLMPAHHVFYGVIALALAVYALIGVNLGGFLIGTILACVGGVLVVAWMTPEARATDAPVEPDAAEEDAGTPADPDAETPGAEETDPVEAPVDDAAPVFSGIPASMRSGGLSFTGLHGISIVSVPTADGGSVRALKITADSITITDFALTVRPPDGPGLVTNADTMSLTGNVAVYLGSVSASSMGGDPLTIGTDTPPPLDDVEPGLLGVTMGLVGSTADVISYTNTDQRIVE